jgi:hypothetical protein
MHLDRTDDEEDITLPSATTRRKEFLDLRTTRSALINHSVHGYDGIILEVSESSQVVSVMLF